MPFEVEQPGTKTACSCTHSCTHPRPTDRLITCTQTCKNKIEQNARDRHPPFHNANSNAIFFTVLGSSIKIMPMAFFFVIPKVRNSIGFVCKLLFIVEFFWCEAGLKLALSGVRTRIYTLPKPSLNSNLVYFISGACIIKWSLFPQ
jgi:hypothetical protein